MNYRELRFAAVPYLNALPLYVGLKELLPEVQFDYLPPSEVAQHLRFGRADLGLVPAIALLDPGMEDFVTLPDLGICCRGEVQSVYVAAKKPFDQIQELYLDPDSRSSASLVRILAPEFLPTGIRFLATFPGYEKEIRNNRAGLIIGDRALLLREEFPFRLDLGQAWLDYTGLPFVFALWAIRRDRISDRIVEALRLAGDIGLGKADEIADQWAKINEASPVVARRYLQEHIRYRLSPAEHNGLKRFIHLSIALDFIHPQREICFYESSAHRRSGIGGKEAIRF